MSTNYSKIKDDAWRYYQTWRTEVTYCKVLGKNVKITRKGWDHLTSGNKSRRRKIKDKINRLNMLKDAKYIVRNAKKYSLNIKNNTKYFVLESEKGKRKHVIKVILKEDKKGNLYFFSVMRK